MQEGWIHHDKAFREPGALLCGYCQDFWRILPGIYEVQPFYRADESGVPAHPLLCAGDALLPGADAGRKIPLLFGSEYRQAPDRLSGRAECHRPRLSPEGIGAGAGDRIKPGNGCRYFRNCGDRAYFDGCMYHSAAAENEKTGGLTGFVPVHSSERRICEMAVYMISFSPTGGTKKVALHRGPVDLSCKTSRIAVFWPEL